METRFEADGTGTLVTMRMTLPDEATRKRMRSTGMEGWKPATNAWRGWSAPVAGGE